MPSQLTRITRKTTVSWLHLIPKALYHAFAACRGDVPDLLTRRQHEMITTVVSAVNRCQY
jgi:hypothetical protein